MKSLNPRTCPRHACSTHDRRDRRARQPRLYVEAMPSPRHACFDYDNGKRGIRALVIEKCRHDRRAYTLKLCLAHDMHTLPKTGEARELSSPRAQARTSRLYVELCLVPDMYALRMIGEACELSHAWRGDRGREEERRDWKRRDE